MRRKGTALSEIFLSYARSTEVQAHAIAEGLRALGYEVWRDDALPAHRPYAEVIEERLEAARAVVVVWSAEAARSEWVQSEADRARSLRKLVQLSIDGTPLPMPFDRIQCADLNGWTGDPVAPGWMKITASIRDLFSDIVPALTAGPAHRPGTAADRVGVCVLPFTNMSGEAEQEYFSDGISEDIITDLSKVSSLAVVSRNTAFTFKGRSVAVSEVARQLGVTHVLEGSVRKAGNRVRITAQLVECAGDSHVWAERFDRTLEDIFAIQDEISRAVVGALKVRLAPAEERALEHRHTASAEAYELYLLARQFGRTGSERMKPLIVRICTRAVELDPKFGPAWAQLALAEAEVAQRGVEGASFDRALQAAERAIATAPTLADAHAAMAEVLTRGPSMDTAGAQSFVDAALRLDPDCYDAHLGAGYISISQQRWSDAARQFEAAVALDPVAYRPAGMVIQVYEALGDAEAAQTASRRCAERCERILAVEPDHSGALGMLVASLAALGEADRTREWARRAALFDPENARLQYNIACGLARLPDAEAACDVLERMIDKVNAGWFRWMETDNSLDLIRTHPRYLALISRGTARFA
jgi:adenylate cyclase